MINNRSTNIEVCLVPTNDNGIDPNQAREIFSQQLGRIIDKFKLRGYRGFGVISNRHKLENGDPDLRVYGVYWDNSHSVYKFRMISDNLSAFPYKYVPGL